MPDNWANISRNAWEIFQGLEKLNSLFEKTKPSDKMSYEIIHPVHKLNDRKQPSLL